MATPVLQVRNLTTRFKTERGVVTAVDNISFEVAAGETLAIVGESGSGKSVTSMSILRLIPSPPGRIENGEILFDGKDLLKLSEDEMRAIRGDRIAMIFQDSMSSLNPSITIGKQIAEPITLHRNASWNEAYEKARDLLSMVQIPDAQSRLSVYPHQFSGGMRQRSMIAMALACQPKLIIADEPTTALDVTVQAQILDLLKDLTQKAQTSMILITHDMGVVARYADRVAVMYGGRIVEQGPAREIFNRPAHPYTQGLLASIPRILWRHVLPNVIPPLIVLFTSSVGTAILAESGLSFLGLGVPPPHPTWGGMLSGNGRTYMLQGPWLALAPGICLTLVVYAINVFGDALRDMLDPRMRGSR